jgi:hypothetical protein
VALLTWATSHESGAPRELRRVSWAGRDSKTRQAKTAQPGSPFTLPDTMATNWAAGIIVSEVDAS